VITADDIADHQVRLARDCADRTSGWRWLFDRILEGIARGVRPSLHERERVAEFLNNCDPDTIIRARSPEGTVDLLNARAKVAR
jgi:hypothetical protein